MISLLVGKASDGLWFNLAAHLVSLVLGLWSSSGSPCCSSCCGSTATVIPKVNRQLGWASCLCVEPAEGLGRIILGVHGSQLEFRLGFGA